MQKKLIALAVAGLVSGGAFAQASNVTISGLVRTSWEQFKKSDVVAPASSGSENRVSDQSSMLVFSGREDLGGGMYAGFQIDNRFSPDLGAIAASGNTNVHIGGNWGRVSMGRQDLHYGSAIESYKAYTLQNILSNGPFAQVNGTTVAVGSRTPNAVWYDSPTWSGFSVRVAGSSNIGGNEGAGINATGGKNPSDGAAWNLALNYANGPIKAGYSYWTSKNEGGKGATYATADQRGDTLQFGYAFPMGLTVGLAWNKSRLDTTVGESSRTSWLLPVSYTFGNNQIAFTYNKANNLSGGFRANNSDTGASAYTLAYGYSLSKRTNVGAAYTKISNQRNATYNVFANAANGTTVTAAGEDPSQFSINVNHSF